MGSRKAQVLHTRLRTNCSSLNLDLFLKNISDSPLCRCGSVENAQHYFFHCRYYQVQRIELLNSVSQYQTPSLSLLLHVNDSFSLGTNTVIFEKVHKFIMDSNVFENIIQSKASGWFCLCQYWKSLCLMRLSLRIRAPLLSSVPWSANLCSVFFLDLSLSLSLSLSL